MSLEGRSAPGRWPQDSHSTGLFLQQTFLVPLHLSQRHQMLGTLPAKQNSSSAPEMLGVFWKQNYSCEPGLTRAG